MISNALPEIVHIPPEYQRFKSSLDIPRAAAAIIRHSPSTTRTLGMSVKNCSTLLFLFFIHSLFTYGVSCIVRSIPGQYTIELKVQNSSNEASDHQDTNLPNSTSTWPV
jgi:hypothetical protein